MSKRTFRVLFGFFLLNSDVSALIAQENVHVDAYEPQNISRPLSPPSEQVATTDNSQARSGSFMTTLGALGLILLIFLGLVQMWKKRTPHSTRKLPEEVWQELGSTRLDHRYQVRLIRVGARVLVIGQSETYLQTLSEITTAEEVANLVAQCGQSSHDDQKSRFHSLYEQFRSRIEPRETTVPESAGRSARESHGE